VALTLEQCWHRVPGGTAVAALELAHALRGRPEVTAIGVAARHREPPPAAFRPPIEVRHLGLPRPVLYDSWLYLRRPPVSRATGPIDVVHATTIVTPPRSAPLVVTIHDLAFLHADGHASRRGRRVFERSLALVRQDADLVVCSSMATLEDCAAHGIDRARLRLVPLGVRSQPATPDDIARVRRRYGLDGPYVLFAGTNEPRKNLPRLVQACGGMPGGLTLVLAGPAGWGEQVAAGGSVNVLGVVSPDDLRALYAGAAVFAYPSLREGFGLPVLEAMAQGAPVVTSRGTSTEEAAGGAAVLVDPRDVADIRRGLEEAQARRAELAAAGRARAAAASWSVTAELTVAAYREVTSRG
jgi:glycosyltransferase involved in cell wall biosynthesis